MSCSLESRRQKQSETTPSIQPGSGPARSRHAITDAHVLGNYILSWINGRRYRNACSTEIPVLTAFSTMYLCFRRRKPPRLLALVTFCTFVFALASQATAIWPFPPKRFTGNTLLGAGTMGLNDDERVIAFGDFNGDQSSVFIFGTTVN